MNHITDQTQNIYLVGIGGAGMSGLAKILKKQGFTVAGSELRETVVTEQLADIGIRIHYGQTEPGFDASCDLLIYSTAITENHVERAHAKQLNVKTCHRAEILAELLKSAETSIAVTGTHGKTTTSALASFLLDKAQVEPTCFVGSEMLNFENNVLSGKKSGYWIAEVDESDRSHELYEPHYAILTNLELDHHDHYESLKVLKQSFEKFLSKIENPGFVVYSGDNELLNEIVAGSGRPSVSFGLSDSCDYSAKNISLKPFGSEFDLYEGEFFLTRVNLSLSGIHNIYNAMSVLVLLIQMGFEIEALVPHLSDFKGTRRRFEVKWQGQGLTVIDDYAHHPTEVKAVLRALGEVGKKVLAVFQPHRYSRTKQFYSEFAEALHDGHDVFLTDVYAAGESVNDGVSSELIYEDALKRGFTNIRLVKKEQLLSVLESEKEKQDVIAFLGAGDIGEVADEFVCQCKESDSH